MTNSRKRPSEQAIDRHVGARLRAFRLHRGWTQGELAERLGISYQQIQKYECGGNRVSAGTLYRIARLLGAGVAAFFEEVEDVFPPSPRPAPVRGEVEAAEKLTDPFRVLSYQANNPYPSTEALKISFAIAGISNPRLKAAILEMIGFAVTLR